MQNKQVLEKLSQIQNQLSENDKPLPLEEASKYLNISKSYLYKLTCKTKIAYFKPNGKKIYFLKSDLNNWLKE